MSNFLQKAASNVFFKIRRNIFGIGVPKPPPPSAPPVVRTVPRFTPPPVDKEQPGVIYKAPEEKKTQLERWQELNPQTEEQKSLGTEEEQKSEDQISFIPVSRGRLAPHTQEPTSEQLEQEGEKLGQYLKQKHQRQSEYLMVLAARPVSTLDRGKDAFQDLLSILTFGLVPRPRVVNAEERVAQAIQLLKYSEPSLAESQIVKDLEANTPGISQEVTTTTGQVKSLRFIPEERIETEKQRPLYQQAQESYLPMQISPGRLIRFLPRDTFERLITQRFGPEFSRVASSLGQNALSRGLISGQGLIGGALRGLGGQAARFAAGMGARMATMAAVGTSWAWLPWVVGGALVLIVVGGGIFLLLGPITTRQAAFVGGEPGDSQPAGNRYIDIQIISSKSSIPNNGLPTDVVFTITIKPKNEAFTSTPKISASVTMSGKAGGKTLANTSWPDSERTLKIDLGQDLEDSIVSLAVTVTVSVEGQSEPQVGAATSVVRIGNPVTACPSGWPTKGYVSQGPDGPYSHQGSEAIDVEGILGRRIYASFDGTAIPYTDKYGGKDIRISSVCDGRKTDVDFVHFSAFAISGPTPVKAGDLLGYMGHTGFANTDHLHYQFYGTEIKPPYVPLPVPRRCLGKAACGNLEFNSSYGPE